MQTSPGRNRIALALWLLAATVGTIGVWYLSSYLEELATLAQIDPDAALVQFRSRALPALVLIVAAAVAAGATLMRQGLQLVHRNPARGETSELSGNAESRSARTVGSLLAAAGFILAAVPLALLSIVLWFLRTKG